MPDRLELRELGGVIAAALRDGPLLAAARVERALRAACPELAQGWAAGHVARLVAAGKVPEQEVVLALSEFRAAEARGGIGNRAAYLAAILRRHLARHGQPWRKAG